MATNTKKYLLILGGLFVLFEIYVYFHLPPKDFPVGDIITIPTGETLQDITNRLYAEHVIAWPIVFRSHVILQGGEKRVIAGDYLLPRAEGPADLAYRFVHGDFGLNEKKVTIPEGYNVFQIADTLQKNLVNFNTAEFLKLAKPEEGKLFPDTYFISPVATPDVVIEMMKTTFIKKILSVKEIATSPHKFNDIIKLASIIELEASSTESRKVVAGILWKRLSLNMPLQVDAAFTYVTGKNISDITAKDLKIDSPYNTYLHAGLPPTPVGNPGLDAIRATVSPTETAYLYYISDKSGNLHYAKTLSEQNKNIAKYLQ